MKFCQLKSEQDCFYCGSTMSYGEEAVVTRIRRKNGTFNLKIAHVECFQKWSGEEFSRRYFLWKENITLRPKKRKYRKKKITGRPRVFSHPVIAARLRGLIHYYRKRGDSVKVEELQAELNTMREGSNAGNIC